MKNRLPNNDSLEGNEKNINYYTTLTRVFRKKFKNFLNL